MRIVAAVRRRWNGFGPREGFGLVVTGILGLVTDAVSPSPSWAVGFGWVAFAGFCILLIVLGVRLYIGGDPNDSRERLRKQGADLLDELSESYGWRAFLNGGTPADLLQRIDDWREKVEPQMPGRYVQAWGNVWTAPFGEVPRSREPDDLAVHERAEWQWRMRRALALIRQVMGHVKAPMPS